MQMKEFFTPTDADEPFRRPWLRATGQEGRLRLLYLLPLWLGLIWVVKSMARFAKVPDYVQNLIEIAGALLTLGCLLYPVIAIRCQECGCKVLAYFMTHSAFHRWLPDLQTTTTCPKCGSAPHDFRAPEEK